MSSTAYTPLDRMRTDDLVRELAIVNNQLRNERKKAYSHGEWTKYAELKDRQDALEVELATRRDYEGV